MKAENRKTAFMWARVTAAQKAKYAALAKELGIRESDLVRQALADYEQAEIESGWIASTKEQGHVISDYLSKA